jgi:hypothetical protein
MQHSLLTRGADGVDNGRTDLILANQADDCDPPMREGSPSALWRMERRLE